MDRIYIALASCSSLIKVVYGLQPARLDLKGLNTDFLSETIYSATNIELIELKSSTLVLLLNK